MGLSVVPMLAGESVERLVGDQDWSNKAVNSKIQEGMGEGSYFQGMASAR